MWLPDEKRLLPVDYNDKSGYKRLTVMDGLRLKADLGSWKLSSVTSIQMLFDSMNMDSGLHSGVHIHPESDPEAVRGYSGVNPEALGPS